MLHRNGRNGRRCDGQSGGDGSGRFLMLGGVYAWRADSATLPDALSRKPKMPRVEHRDNVVTSCVARIGRTALWGDLAAAARVRGRSQRSRPGRHCSFELAIVIRCACHEWPRRGPCDAWRVRIMLLEYEELEPVTDRPTRGTREAHAIQASAGDDQMVGWRTGRARWRMRWSRARVDFRPAPGCDAGGSGSCGVSGELRPRRPEREDWLITFRVGEHY
jgi:hypothetical protein